MRKFEVPRGTYKGPHYIYDSVEEAEKYGIQPKDPWYRKDIKVGDWVVANDGYVQQCLNRYPLPNKRAKHGQYTDVYQFPQGTSYVYYDAKGNPNIKNFYGALTQNRRTQLGDSSTLGRYMTIKKKLFVTLIAGGQNPYVAYCMAFNKNTSPPYVVTRKVNELLSDEAIREELMEALKPFAKRVEERILQLTKYKYENLDDFFVDKTARLLIRENRSATAELAVIQFGYKFLGKHLQIVMDKEASTKKEIQEAEFRELPSPLLGNYKPTNQQ